jgi:type I restriction enzyme R subunit
MPLNEADTCRVYVTPKIKGSGWEKSLHSITERHYFIDSRVKVKASAVSRLEGKRADCLRYTRDFTISVVEAKPEDDPAGNGLQQAKEYAEILGLKFDYATNGHEIIEFDYLTGVESVLSACPTPHTRNRGRK